MNIVHYTLGLYPKRTGGLNRYVTDLAVEQSKEHNVSLLIPGRWRPLSRRCSVSKARMQDGIKYYCLNNPLPLPLLYGIRKPQKFITRPICRDSFESFYETVRPDVLHVHTLMGITEDVIVFFKEKGVRIVYTSHDYFGICPKVNLINQNGELCEGPSAERCMVCNQHAPSTLFLRLRNSSLAFKTRDLLRWFRNT